MGEQAPDTPGCQLAVSRREQTLWWWRLRDLEELRDSGQRVIGENLLADPAALREPVVSDTLEQKTGLPDL